MGLQYIFLSRGGNARFRSELSIIELVLNFRYSPLETYTLNSNYMYEGDPPRKEGLRLSEKAILLVCRVAQSSLWFAYILVWRWAAVWDRQFQMLLTNAVPGFF